MKFCKVTAFILSLTVLIGCLTACGSSAEENTVKTYVEGWLMAKPNDFLNALPPKFVDHMLEASGASKNKLTSALEVLMMQGPAVCAIDGLSYKINEIDITDSALSESTQEFYEGYGGDKISEQKWAHVSLTLSDEEDTIDSSTDIPLIRAGSKWYVDIMSSDLTADLFLQAAESAGA